MATEASSTGAPPEPLTPGAPTRLIGWLRPSARSRGRVSLPIRVGVAILVTLTLGTWGFAVMRLGDSTLTFPQSLFNSIRLYTLDNGPAALPGSHPGWQIFVAFVFAALLVARGVLGLARERLGGMVTHHVVRGHAVICGAGVHGSRLAAELGKEHDVVVIDRDRDAHGMHAPYARYEWRLTGDPVREEMLLAAGVDRANWVVAITDDDFVNSQVVSTVRALAEDGHTREGLQLLVQVEDQAMARFLEESDEGGTGHDGPAGAGASVPRSVVSPFSSNAIAAEAVIDDFLGRLPDDRAPNLLLVGDHPAIEAIAFAALRRWRVQVLADSEHGVRRPRWPFHVRVLGPAATERVERMRTQWRPEPDVLAIEAKDTSTSGEPLRGAEAWLTGTARPDHAVVACNDELTGIALTLAVSRAVGPDVRVTRLTAQLESVLDLHLEQRTSGSRTIATTNVESIAELACDVKHMSRVSGPERLADALQADGREPGAAHAAAKDLFSRRLALGLRSDASWKIRPLERSMVRALIDGISEGATDQVPLSALVRAGLRVSLTRPENLRIAAEHLPAEPVLTRNATWIEYARSVGGASAGASSPGEPQAQAILALTARARAVGRADPEAGRAVIFVGAAKSMTPIAEDAIGELIDGALVGYDGMILSGGTAEGVPGLVGRAAARLGLSDRLVGYVPRGFGDHDLYPQLRETGSADFGLYEPLLMWAEILGKGIPIENVRVVAFPGGPITKQEILLARALGAKVGWLDPACEESDSLEETLPFGADGVLELPDDPMTVRAFISWSRLPDELRDEIGEFIHNAYRRQQRIRKPPGDPALAPWGELMPSLRASNLAQADDIPSKLALIGKEIRAGGEPLKLTDSQLETLAEAEHGRWTIERLSAGWVPGQRQVIAGISPDLKPWRDLDNETRQYDLDAIRTIPASLAAVGWGVADAG
jgi:voltage-gated potassium channel Kch